MAMASSVIAGHVQGLREAKAAFQALPDIVRDRMLAATETTLREIQRLARGHLVSSPSIRTRNLYNRVQWTLNRKTGFGRAGIASGSIAKGTRMDRPSRRAHFVEFGTRKMRAEPFMIPSADAEAQPHVERCRAQGPLIEQDMAKIGLRNL
jgi:hypothetical protein